MFREGAVSPAGAPGWILDVLRACRCSQPLKGTKPRLTEAVVLAYTNLAKFLGNLCS